MDCSNQYFPFIRKETLKFACQSSAECSCCFSHFLLVLGFKGVWFPDHQLALTSTECFPPQSIETEVSSFITAAKRQRVTKTVGIKRIGHCGYSIMILQKTDYLCDVVSSVDIILLLPMFFFYIYLFDISFINEISQNHIRICWQVQEDEQIVFCQFVGIFKRAQ